MPARLRPLVVPLVLILLAATAYQLRISREMADFDVYRTAAARVAVAEPLYREADGHYQFKYLPFFAVLMIPFGLVDAGLARAVWFGLSVGVLTAYIRWAVRALPERRRVERTLIWLTVLFMTKFYLHELTLGQSNLVLGAILVAALLAAQVDQPVLAGALVGLAAFAKPYALVLLPWLAFSYGAAAAGAGLAVVAIGLMAPAVLYGWAGNLDQLVAWARTVVASTAPNLTGHDNISFAAMWAKWIGVGPVASTLAAATSAAALGLVVAVWRRRTRVSVPDYLEVSLLMLLVPLLSPQGWDYVLLLATPAVVCLMDRWSDLTPAWRAVTAAALSLMGLTIFDVMGRALYGRFMALSIVSVAAIAVAVALAHLRWRALA